MSHKEKELYRYLLDFYQGTGGEESILKNLLKYDLLHRERMVELPDWAGPRDPDLKDFSFQFWRDPVNRTRFPEFDGLAIRDIQRRILMAEFDFDPVALSVNPEMVPVFNKQLVLFIYTKNEGKAFNIHHPLPAEPETKEIYMNRE